MKQQLPTSTDIERLIAYLPRLYAPGFEPVARWEGGTKYADGFWRLPWPEYDPLVAEFFRQLAAECWSDYGYKPEIAYRMLMEEGGVEQASLEQIKTMLTFCLRGERFSDGHWEEMIKQGHIRRLLTRLQALREGDPI